LCVLTGRDFQSQGLGGMPPLFMPEDSGGPKGYRTYRPALAHEKVRYVGDRVAFVVAETVNQARDAAELIEIEYEPLPSVISPEDAIKDGAPLVYEDCPNNRSCTVMFGDEAATNPAFASAAHVVSIRLENNRVTANALEPRAAIGEYDVGQ